MFVAAVVRSFHNITVNYLVEEDRLMETCSCGLLFLVELSLLGISGSRAIEEDSSVALLGLCWPALVKELAEDCQPRSSNSY